MKRIIFTNANLIDVEAGAKSGATVIIAGDRVESVTFGTTPRSFDEATVVDLKGRSVLPGLFNCHYHASYRGVGGTGVPVGMEAAPALQALRAAQHVGLALDCGFTGLVSAGAPHGIDAALQAAIQDGTIRGPRIMAGSRDVSSTGHCQDLAYPWHWGPGQGPSTSISDGPDAFRRAVREEIKRGAEIIKIFLTPGHAIPGADNQMDLTPAELAAAIEAAHDRSVKVRAHIAHRRGIMTALSLGIDVIDHGDGMDEACIELMIRQGVFLVPSMLFPHRLAQLVKGPFADSMKASTEQMLGILPKANKAGVKIVLGDDFGANPLVHGTYGDELDYYVNVAGIPPRDVLRWATRNGADLMGRGHELGTVKAGALADLIVVDGDPLTDIRVLQRRENILTVLKGGQFEKNLLAATPAAAASDRRRAV